MPSRSSSTVVPADLLKTLLSPSSLALREMPALERPRERLRRNGPSSLSTVELVAIMLGAGAKGRSTLEVSRDVLASTQGSLRRLASVPIQELIRVRGIGHVRAILLHAAIELGRRAMAESLDEGIPLRRAEDIYHLYAHRIEDLPYEEFHVGILDGKHRLEDDVLVTRGILNSSLVHAREVFRGAIARNACAVILVHNHPSGDPTPSDDDYKITSDLLAAGKILGIEVLDHVIVGRGRFASFSEAGLMV
jgi:DNA repair protein RadC